MTESMLSDTDRDTLRRLERLPMTRVQIRLLIMGGLGYTFDAMDLAIVAFILPVVITAFGLTNEQTGVLGSASMIGYLFGAFLAGALGDLIGRRSVMLYALAFYSIATIASAAAPGWHFLFWSRTVAGVGFGAESAIIAPFLSEFIQGKYRGRYIGSLSGFFSFGFVFAALLGNFVVPASSAGWRIVLLICAAPIVLLLWWRRGIAESPRWLIQRGRSAEAERIVSRMETEVARHVAGPLPALETVDLPVITVERNGSFGRNLAALFGRKLLRSTAMLWILWFSITFAYYGFFTWIPTLLVKQGLTVTRSFGYSFIIYLAMIPGYYSAAFLSEKLDRKWTIILYLMCGGLAALAMASTLREELITIFGFILSFFMNGTYAGLYAYTPEVYPTAIRATGMGVASSFGRLGGIAAPIIIGYAFESIGFGGVFVITTAVLMAGALAVGAFGIRTSGKSLEQISAE
jgi:MFS transporter, putative metabolite:H+ symporter